MRLAVDIIAAAKASNLKITCAESCTGGMLCSALTDVPGSSEVFERGFIAYSNKAKIQMLKVSETSLQIHGAVSEPVALEMALGAKDDANADISIAVSGIAGPGGSDFKPEGRVSFGICWTNGTASETIEFGALGRKEVRNAATQYALKLIFRHLGAAY
jgi:nicotinamide-nucleotide amidase